MISSCVGAGCACFDCIVEIEAFISEYDGDGESALLHLGCAGCRVKSKSNALVWQVVDSGDGVTHIIPVSDGCLQTIFSPYCYFIVDLGCVLSLSSKRSNYIPSFAVMLSVAASNIYQSRAAI